MFLNCFSSSQHFGTVSEHDAATAFLTCDCDKNGYIGRRDLRAVLHAIQLDCPPEVVNEMIAMCEQSGGLADGYLCQSHFVIYLCIGKSIGSSFGSCAW